MTFETYLVNESIEGMRVAGFELEELKFGETMEIELDDRTVVGKTRSVSQNKDGKFEIGIQRDVQESLLDESEKKLLATFVCFDNHWISCTVDRACDNEPSTIRLANGKEFTTPKGHIFIFNREQRSSMLQDKDELKKIRMLYEFMLSRKLPDVDSIIEYEFSNRCLEQVRI